MDTKHLTPTLRAALRALSTGKALTQSQKSEIYGYIEHLADLTSPAQAPSDTESVALEMEAYRVALQHIANGHPNPAGFANVFLQLGAEKEN